MYNLPEGTIIENGNIIRIGPQGAEMFFADGRQEFPEGTVIEFDILSYAHLNTISALIQSTVGENRNENLETGCNIAGNATPLMLLLLLILGYQLVCIRENFHRVSLLP
jgi:hypothetical protein